MVEIRQMIIKNLTKKTLLTDNAKICTSFLDTFLGLLNKNNPNTLIFNTRFGIHTLFLKSSIDVLILDTHNKVVKLKTNLSPNRFFIWNPKYFKVIELPSGTIKKTKTKLKDQLIIL